MSSMPTAKSAPKVRVGTCITCEARGSCEPWMKLSNNRCWVPKEEEVAIENAVIEFDDMEPDEDEGGRRR